MADDEGVLGNLPRSRPGKRSEKRNSGGRPSKTASRAAEKAEAGGKAAAKPPRAGPDPVRPRPADTATQQSGDAVASAVRTAATVAVTGVRVAGAVTREIRRRLPLP